MRCADTNLMVLQAFQTFSSQGNVTEGPILFFKGSRPLCSAEIKQYASQHVGNHLRYINASAKDAHLGSDLVCGACVFMALWSSLHGTKWTAQLTKIPGVIEILEVTYRAFRRARPLMIKVVRYFAGQSARSSSNEI